MRRAVVRTLQCLALILAATWVWAGEEKDEPEGGILGTGIVGTITRLGSIYVNDQHIRFDRSLIVADSLGPAGSVADLRPGHTVAVVAQPEGADWRAAYIRQIYPVVGPVEAVRGNRIEVLGTRVVLPTGTAVPEVGTWVAVSGLWRDNRVVATRVDAVPEALREARVSGTFLGRTAGGDVRVGGSRISGIEPRHLRPGMLVRSYGQPVPGGIAANRLETRLVDVPVGVIQVEGYFSPRRADGLYTILGSGLVAYSDDPNMVDRSRREVRCGQSGQLDDTSTDSGVVARLQC